MTIYSVFEAQKPGLPDIEAVPEKFSWLACILPPVFFLAHRLVLPLLGYIVALALLVAGARLLGGAAVGWLYLLLAAWIGCEAPHWRRQGLLRRHFAYRGEIIAAGPDLAALDWLKARAEP